MADGRLCGFDRYKPLPVEAGAMAAEASAMATGVVCAKAVRSLEKLSQV